MAGYRVIKERRATISTVAGIDAHRPAARGAASWLYLAGDWVDTGWPPTMEGAVRGGYLAAAAVMADVLGERERALVGELPAGWLVRALGRFG